MDSPSRPPTDPQPDGPQARSARAVANAEAASAELGESLRQIRDLLRQGHAPPPGAAGWLLWCGTCGLSRPLAGPELGRVAREGAPDCCGRPMLCFRGGGGGEPPRPPGASPS
jgi:hypothetical protein